MAQTGVYGCRIPVNVTSDDVEIFYSYRPTLNNDSEDEMNFVQLSSNILVQSTISDSSSTARTDNVLEGMYNLKLPVEQFNKKGFYTVYIKPKEYPMVITDVSTLQAYPNVRGIVLSLSDISQDSNGQLRTLMSANNGLAGYRIVYYDENGNRENYFRIITSNNRCEPVVGNISNSSQKLTQYRYNNASSFVFVTLTPSTAPSYNSDASPYIGSSGQKIALVNTLFEPICLEIEMVEHDADTISTMLEGSQLRDLDNGLVTTFNEDDEIYNQAEHYSLKDSYTGDPIYEIKKNKTENIDYSQTLNNK